TFFEKKVSPTPPSQKLLPYPVVTSRVWEGAGAACSPVTRRGGGGSRGVAKLWQKYRICQQAILMELQQVVIPAKAGIQGLCDLLKKLDPGLRRGDG
ncbi:MAG: hypothetical protein ABIM40_06325, partial [Pseudomonadota bacterium]